MLFLDSSDPDEIARIGAWGVTRGITTNPLILARQGVRELPAHLERILAVSRGPVAVELVTETDEAMMQEARELFAMDRARIVIKVPFSEAGLRVTATLAEDGVPTNVTCCMSTHQTLLASLAGARYVSLFSGRIRDMGYSPADVIGAARELIDRGNGEAEIIVGSVRHLADVTEGLLAGAHIVTVPPGILRAMLKHPKTEETIREFNDAWNKRKRDA